MTQYMFGARSKAKTKLLRASSVRVPIYPEARSRSPFLFHCLRCCLLAAAPATAKSLGPLGRGVLAVIYSQLMGFVVRNRL